MNDQPRHLHDGPEPAGPIDPVGPETAMAIDVDRFEWRQVVGRLRHALAPDERYALGKYAVVIAGGRRRWIASDSYRLMTYDAGPDDGAEGILLVPQRLLDAWPLVASVSGSARIVAGEEPDSGTPTVTIDGPGGSLSVQRDDRNVIDLERLLDDASGGSRTSFTIDSAAFAELVRIASVVPPVGHDEPDLDWPFMWIEIGDGSLVMELDWAELGPTRYSIPVESTAQARVPVNPGYLAEMISVFEPGDLHVELPSDASDMVVVRQGPLTGLLMPIDPSFKTIERVEEVLAGVFGENALHTDPDGDYQLSSKGVPVYGRVIPGEPTRLVLFAVVLADVELTEELLVELNQINAVTGMAKARWDDGAVLIQGELVADTADPAEVVAVYERITSFADGLGEILAARYGGAALQPGQDVRWAGYEDTLLRAELVPGEWLPLNGPDATTAFPFEDPVFVMTASDPHGVSRPVEVNVRDRGALASDLTRIGAGFVRARCCDDGGVVVDHGFLVWGVDEPTVIGVAADYSQEAIFRLTDDEVTLIGVNTDRRNSMPRRG